jgi:hypothetical protein
LCLFVLTSPRGSSLRFFLMGTLACVVTHINDKYMNSQRKLDRICTHLSLIIKRQNFRLFFSSIHLFCLSPFNYRTLESFFYLDSYIYNPCLYKNTNLNRNPSFPYRICLYFPIYNLYSWSHNPFLLQFESDNNSTYGAINSLMWIRNSFLNVKSQPNLCDLTST